MCNVTKMLVFKVFNIEKLKMRDQYLYSDTEGSAQLGPPIRVQDTLCISMFVALCHTCTLQLIVRTTTKVDILVETIVSTDGMWKEIQVVHNTSRFRGQDLLFFVRKISLTYNTKGLWALDDVRLCRENEYRYIKSEEYGTPCQKIEIGNDIILTNSENNKIEKQGMNCPENAIGMHCVPCQLFNNNSSSSHCANFKYCEIIDGREKCHCTSKFVEDCTTRCSHDTYGYGCQKTCSPYCSDAGCRYIDGSCLDVGCKYAFTGRKCDIPPQSSYEVEFSWQENNDLSISLFDPNLTNGEVKKIRVILESHGNQQQIRRDLTLSWNKFDHFTIKSGLFMACTNFDVRIYSYNDNNKHNHSKYISHKIFSPPQIPPDIPEENIHYNRTNVTITVRIKHQDIGFGNYSKATYIVVSKSEKKEDLEFMKNILDGKMLMSTLSRRVFKSIRTNQTEVFTIGQQSKNTSNPPLEPGTNYSISLFFVNECNGEVRLRKIQKYIITMENSELYDPGTGIDYDQNAGNELWALSILSVVPLIGFGYWFIRRKNRNVDVLSEPSDLHVYEIPNETNQIPEGVYEIPREINEITEGVYEIPENISETYHDPVEVLPMSPSKNIRYAMRFHRTKYSREIQLADFVNYVKNMMKNGQLDIQNKLYLKGLSQIHEGVDAYAHTRVELGNIAGEEYSNNHIEANYIDGHKTSRVYIAAHGPINSTLSDLWKLIWQENIRNVVMLASMKKKIEDGVEKYWPHMNRNSVFGGMKIQFVSEKVFADFDVRTFVIHCENQKRQVEQLYYKTWPNHGVPFYPRSLVPFFQRILKISYNSSFPILIYSGVDVDQSGTIILCDICLRMAASENVMDFLANVKKLRDQRANMVASVEQYKLAHLVVLECLFGMRTTIKCSKDMEHEVMTVLQNDGVAEQMKYLIETQWQDSVMGNEIYDKPYYICAERNMSEPDQNGPVSSYIDAVFVDDYRIPCRYIVTQQPMPNTFVYFWRLVFERNCFVIINLNSGNRKNRILSEFWPTEGKQMRPVASLAIHHVNTEKFGFYNVTRVLVEVNNTEKSFVNIISIDSWEPGELLPNNTDEFLAFREAADVLSRNSPNVLVTCFDGATASGLYLAMSFLIEQMKLEQECDVCLAVRSIRRSRSHFVVTKEQYEFLLRASLTYRKGFQDYANFD